MTDTDNTQPQDAERRQLARALHLPDGLPFASLINAAEEQRIDLAAVRAAHESRRRTLSGALNLGTSAPWDAITEQAGTVQAPASERATTAEAALARVRESCQAVRDRVGPSGMINASQILGLLSPTWPDGNNAAALGDDQPAETDDRCVHLRDGGCCSGPGYCAHMCDTATEPEAAAVVRGQYAARLSHDEIVQRLLDAARPHLARALGFVQDGQR